MDNFTTQKGVPGVYGPQIEIVGRPDSETIREMDNLALWRNDDQRWEFSFDEENFAKAIAFLRKQAG